MTKFDWCLEKLEKRRKAEKENAYNAELLRSLQTRSKQDVVATLYENLTFIVGTTDFATAMNSKTLVF